MSLLELKATLKKYDIRLQKRLGQNFLIDNKVLRDIIMNAEIEKQDHVIEIGPGFGMLTRALAEKASKVTTIECIIFKLLY